MAKPVPTDVASPAAIAHLRLSTVRGIGPVHFGRLLQRFGTAEAVFAASRADLQEVEGIGPTTADEILRARGSRDWETELDLAAAAGVRIVCRADDGFPALLRHIPDPPICLYVKGSLAPEDAVAVAVVGSRRCTHYGREQARRFGYALAERGATVVSGLARGIDAAAHWGAIEAGGRTIAVLGNGLAGVYPPEHADLADRIVAGHGALVSELPMRTSPDRDNFVPRNRIIAGMTLGVLVIEAAHRSGALATARHAAEYDREVFALPGRVDSPFSDGTNALIREQHAKLVCNVKDVFDELGDVGKTLLDVPSTTVGGGDPVPPRLTPQEQRTYEALGTDERSLEQLCAAANLPAGLVSSALISLQLKGLVRQLPGAIFARAAPR